MLNDIRPPKKPLGVVPVQPKQEPATILNNKQSGIDDSAQMVPKLDEKSHHLNLNKSKKKPHIVISLVVLTAVTMLVICFIWYNSMLKPVKLNDTTTQKVQIVEDTSFSYVSGKLQERGLVKSSLVLRIYAFTHGKDKQLKQGFCNLSPSESVAEIVDKLTSGCNDFKSVTFYPGGTLETPKLDEVVSRDFSVRASLRKAGYSDNEITDAFGQKYSGDLFSDKPAGTTLEGYVYGDTYFINTTASVKQALQVSFNEMQKVIKKYNLKQGFLNKGLNLYQGITLASVVQRELSCDNVSDARLDQCYKNQQMIAQVFLTRLNIGMPLGSDVTFIYPAGLTGQSPLPTLDSPYNTRIHTGLPPGPIASPSEHALKAVANPANTDYLYFVAGDEGGGAVYFASDLAGHNKNINEHCKLYCN